jgi:hypothetical protein
MVYHEYDEQELLYDDEGLGDTFGERIEDPMDDAETDPLMEDELIAETADPADAVVTDPAELDAVDTFGETLATDEDDKNIIDKAKDKISDLTGRDK